MGLKWTDSRAIAEELYDNEPDLDPTTLRMTELHAKILALPDFDDDVHTREHDLLAALCGGLLGLFHERGDGWVARLTAGKTPRSLRSA